MKLKKTTDYPTFRVLVDGKPAEIGDEIEVNEATGENLLKKGYELAPEKRTEPKKRTTKPVSMAVEE